MMTKKKAMPAKKESMPKMPGSKAKDMKAMMMKEKMAKKKPMAGYK